MPPPRDKTALDTAAAAYLKGQAGGPDALYWLHRARRLAPEDPRIELDLAQRELANGAAGLEIARGIFQRLAETYDLAPAWVGLAIAAQMRRDPAAAAHALEALLGRHCLPADEEFAGFARHVAQSAGYGGFAGRRADGSQAVHGAGRLLGTPDGAALARVEGLASWEKEGISGWASRPAWPDEPPALILTDAAGQRRAVRCRGTLAADEEAPFLRRHRFRLGPAALAGLTPPFTLAGPGGQRLMGCPLDPRPLQAAPVPAATRGPSPLAIPPQAKLALVMPVYRGLAQTQAAVNSALAALPEGARLIVVDDATPEPALASWLDGLARRKRLELCRHAANQGFCEAANTGLRAAAGADVLLLNSDILLPPGAVESLRALAYADAATGTVTPLSNEATICSYPSPNQSAPMPDLRETARLDRLAREANGLGAVEIPTGVGFCLFIRHDCLEATGLFRGEIFAQGYGEENDFCLRARHLGFRHRLALGAYVAHQGGVSFRAASRGLIGRNLTVLNRLYPGYAKLIAAHVAEDPGQAGRAALDAARLRAEVGRRPAVLLISHAHGGGVARRVDEEIAALRQAGQAPLLLTTRFPPKLAPYPWPSLLCSGAAKDYPNLVFNLPRDEGALLTLLRALRVRRVVRHHLLGHAPQVRGLAAALGVPEDIVAHDYLSFCPRVTLLNRAGPGAKLHYCGEPDLAGCVRCCAHDRGDLLETLPVRALHKRSAAEFAAASRVVVPSHDMARRLARHFPGLKPQVQPWEEPGPSTATHRPGSGARLVAVIGGIGAPKGYDVLLACAEDARRRRLPLSFVVIGTSADDARLLAAGVKITGPYREGEAKSLIQQWRPDLAFLPSIWPETWCYALSEAWGAGLMAVAFDLGAQAERIRARGQGALLPLGLPAERINNALLQAGF